MRTSPARPTGSCWTRPATPSASVCPNPDGALVALIAPRVASMAARRGLCALLDAHTNLSSRTSVLSSPPGFPGGWHDDWQKLDGPGHRLLFGDRVPIRRRHLLAWALTAP